MKITNEELITTTELAEKLKVSRETIRRWNNAGMPRIPLTAGAIRYQLSEVLNWRAEVMADKGNAGKEGG